MHFAQFAYSLHSNRPGGPPTVSCRVGGSFRSVCLAGREVMLAQLAKFRRLTRYGFLPNGLHSLVWYRL